MPFLPHEEHDEKPYEDHELLDSDEPVVPVVQPAPEND
jgi:hypothetical protein